MIYSKDKNFVFFTMEDILTKAIPSKLNTIKEMLCLDDDKSMAVMRYFSWNEEKVQEEWFDNESKISHLTGIKFNKKML